MKRSIYIIIIIIVILGGWYIYKFPLAKYEVMKEAENYLHKKEDAYLIHSEMAVYNDKIGTFLVNVRYKDESDMEYTYAYDKNQHKVYLYHMEQNKNGKSKETKVGKHDSMYFKDQQE